MPTIEELQTWHGQDVHGPDGEKVGTLEHVYVDRETGEPTFAAIKTGVFGLRSNLVPADAVTDGTDGLRVHYEKTTIKDAPDVDADAELTPEEEQRLYAYYNREYKAYDADAFTGPTVAPTAHPAPETRPRGARLRRHVVFGDLHGGTPR